MVFPVLTHRGPRFIKIMAGEDDGTSAPPGGPEKLSEDGAAEKTGVMESAPAQETTTPDAGPDPAPTLLEAEGEGQLQPGPAAEADGAPPEQTFLQEEKAEQPTEPPTGEDAAAAAPDDSANMGGEGPVPQEVEEEHGATALTSENASATASLAAPPADSVGPPTVEETPGAPTIPRAADLGIEPPTKHPASPSNRLTGQQDFRASTEIVDEDTGKPVRGGTPPTGTTTTDVEFASPAGVELLKKQMDELYGNEPAPQTSVDAAMMELKLLKTRTKELVNKLGAEWEKTIKEESSRLQATWEELTRVQRVQAMREGRLELELMEKHERYVDMKQGYEGKLEELSALAEDRHRRKEEVFAQKKAVEKELEDMKVRADRAEGTMKAFSGKRADCVVCQFTKHNEKVGVVRGGCPVGMVFAVLMRMIRVPQFGKLFGLLLMWEGRGLYV